MCGFCEDRGGHLESKSMNPKPVRWMMTGAGKPLVPMEFEISTLAPDEVLCEIAGCGVCHTDLGYYYDGPRTNHALPLCLGHEISGPGAAAGAAAPAGIRRTRLRASAVRGPARGLCPVDPAGLAGVGLALAGASVVADAVTTPFQAVR